MSNNPPVGDYSAAIQVSPLEDRLDDVHFSVIVKDLTNNAAGRTRSFTSSTTFEEFLAQIAKDFNYGAGSFEVAQDDPTAVEETVIEPTHELTLASLNLKSRGVNKFYLRAKDGVDVVKLAEPTADDTAAWKNSNDNQQNAVAANKDEKDANNSANSMGAANSHGGSSYSYWNTKSSTGFVGLANQGATCYLNSLLQSLYMTPEFRNAIYRWRRDGDSKASRIPLELQKLFMLLQTSNEKAIETTSITESFGWKRADAFQQHDVQELLRVLMQALEVAMKDTAQAELFQKLYEGELKDGVKCKSCGYESSHPDKFTDIPLVLKPFGAQKCVESIEEAIAKFVEVELLTGDNKYECSGCKQKVEASKGLTITKLPKLLTLQLKRFEYDFMLDRRIKLGDKVTFPMTLDMGWVLDEDATGPPSADDPPSEYLYELYSIMIHSGSALGGHYFAYIRSFDDGKWYCFNDSSVTEIAESAIANTFGGTVTGRGGYSYASGATAYMLMYRARDPDNNEDFIAKEDLPPHVTGILDEMEEQARLKRQADEERRHQVEMNVYWPQTPGEKPTYRKLLIRKEKTFNDAVAEAAKLWELDIPLERLRLRRYSPHQNQASLTFSGKEEKTLEQLDLQYGANNLLLEEAATDGSFEEFLHTDMYVNVIFYDKETRRFEPYQRIKVSKVANVASLKAAIAAKRATLADQIRLCKEPGYGRKLTVLSQDTMSLSACMVYANSTLLADDGAAEEQEPEYTFIKSDFAQAIDRHYNEKEIELILPGQTSADKGRVMVVDQRLRLSDFKEQVVQPLVDLAPEDFQVHRLSYNGKDWVECNQVTVTLESLLTGNNRRLWIKAGRALTDGECYVQLYLLRIGHEKMFEFLCKVPAKDRLPVPEFKERILAAVEELKAKEDSKFKDLDIPLERMRLREMYSLTASPRGVLMDSATLPYINASTKLCVQLLDGEDEKKNTRDLLLFVRQWCPSTFTLGALQEVVVPAAITSDLQAFADLMQEKFGIPWEHLSFASVSKNHRLNVQFPFEVARLDMGAFPWDDKNATTLGQLGCSMDGSCLLFRDLREKEKELNDEDRARIREEDTMRARAAAKIHSSRSTYYTPRKEKALTINVGGQSPTDKAKPVIAQDDVKVTAL
eukprot:m.90590 g.90590  ORF g.90590 m.90590 type:complete len:1136 (+) comp15013_c1_seq2:388-3795(+)